MRPYIRSFRFFCETLVYVDIICLLRFYISFIYIYIYMYIHINIHFCIWLEHITCYSNFQSFGITFSKMIANIFHKIIILFIFADEAVIIIILVEASKDGCDPERTDLT